MPIKMQIMDLEPFIFPTIKNLNLDLDLPINY